MLVVIACCSLLLCLLTSGGLQLVNTSHCMAQNPIPGSRGLPATPIFFVVFNPRSSPNKYLHPHTSTPSASKPAPRAHVACNMANRCWGRRV